jgi:outer membrane protein
MRHLLLSSVLLASSLAPTLARAEQKIAYVDLQRALLEVDEGKKAKTDLKNDFDKKQKALDVEQDTLKKEKEDLDKRAMAMSDDARRQKEQELQTKLMEVTNHWQTMQKDLSEREHTLTNEIFSKMQGVIADIAQAESLTYVFDRSAGLVYGPPSLDLTNELVRRYNDKFPVKGGAAAPGAKDGSSSGNSGKGKGSK